MTLLHNLVRKAAHNPALFKIKKKIGKRLREVYYDAEELRRLEDKTAPLKLAVDASHKKRINLIIPEIDASVLFGGYIAKFNLAKRLLEFGYDVRLIIADQCEINETIWRDIIAQYNGLEDIFDRLEYQYCYDRKKPVEVSPDDRFIATTWWTAYLAHAATTELGREKFLYLIQEFEPFTYPMGSYFAIAKQSYSFPHRALYSSPQLHDYFKQEKLGQFEADWGKASEAMPFENAILSYQPQALKIGQSQPKKLLFYSRPEAHASRNMFEVAYLALAQAIKNGVFDQEKWAFYGIGSSHSDIPLPNGHTLKMLGKFGLKEYKQRLLDYDIGLSLMYTPHPSLLPLEMAAAGMLVVTNECLNKTNQQLQAISSNLIGAKPTFEDTAKAIAYAVANVSDIKKRQQGAKVNWSSSWKTTFSDEKMKTIITWL